jgi:hypothetical protein
VRCAACDVIRRASHDPTLYDADYHNGVYTRTLSDETAAAKERVRYIDPAMPALDVGAGLGGWCGLTGAEGCDPGMGSRRVLRSKFEDAKFPRRKYLTVTAFDVIEHVDHPPVFLAELERVLHDDGTLWIEIPDYSHDKHWKPEHLWYWDAPQFELLLREHFAFERQQRWPGKITFKCRRKIIPQEIVITVPPGIGDAYWALMAADADYAGSTQEVAVHAVSNLKKQRVGPLIERYPRYRWAGHISRDQVGLGRGDPLWREAYKTTGRFKFPRPHRGCAAFYSMNGNLRNGRSFESLGLQPNWHPALHISPQEAWSAARYSGVVVFHLTDNGFHSEWFRGWALGDLYFDRMADLCRGSRAIFLGAEWDKNSPTTAAHIEGLRRRGVAVEDLVGKTAFDEMMGIVRGARLVYGIASGLSIMSVAVGTRTIMLWGQPYMKEFAHVACPPTPNYIPMHMDDGFPPNFLDTALAA